MAIDRAAITKNIKIYNTFKHNPKKHHEVLKYMMDIYNDAVQNPIQKSQLFADLRDLPDEFLVYLFVEIQIMEEEKDCFTFDEREPGCIKAYFTALSAAFDHLNDLTISHELFKSWHAILTDKKNVLMKSVNDYSSGEYRRQQDSVYLNIDLNDASIAGITYLINLIQNGEFSTLKLSSKKNYDLLKEAINGYLENEFCFNLIEFIFQNEMPDLQKFNLFYQNKRDEIDEKTFKKNIRLTKIVEEINKTLHALNLKKLHYSHHYSIPSKHFFDQLRLLSLGEIEKLILKNLKENYACNANIHYRNICLYQLKIIDKNHLQKTMDLYKVKTHKELARVFLNQLKLDNDSLYIKFPNADEAFVIMDSLIKKYNQEVHTLHLKSTDEKLKFIFGYVQKFLLSHSFIDGNNRLYADVFALWALAQQKLPLVIYYNPFVFYAHHPDEILEVMKLSCANYIVAVNAGKFHKNYYFDFSYKTLSEVEKVKMGEFTMPLRKFLENQALTNLKEKLETKLNFLFRSISRPTIFSPPLELERAIHEDFKSIKSVSSQNELKKLLSKLSQKPVSLNQLVKIYSEIQNEISDEQVEQCSVSLAACTFNKVS